jgi:hypothetical protein
VDWFSGKVLLLFLECFTTGVSLVGMFLGGTVAIEHAVGVSNGTP